MKLESLWPVGASRLVCAVLVPVRVKKDSDLGRRKAPRSHRQKISGWGCTPVGRIRRNRRPRCCDGILWVARNYRIARSRYRLSNCERANECRQIRCGNLKRAYRSAVDHPSFPSVPTTYNVRSACRNRNTLLPRDPLARTSMQAKCNSDRQQEDQSGYQKKNSRTCFHGSLGLCRIASDYFWPTVNWFSAED